ncbi:MAG: hypothetical protein IJE45_05325 [Bacilli bacterium]|nr:hypothetical protein [Bacilli bacterium]
MQYQLVKGKNGERFWLPIIAGAAILSAPFWFNNKQCCNNQQYYPQYYPYPVYPPQGYYPTPYYYPYTHTTTIYNQ